MSGPAAEEALKDRISFIRFSGFSLEGTLPDHSTICRYRNTLLELNLYERLFGEVNRQLEEKNLLVKASNGAIFAATIIESSCRPRKVIDVIPEDRQEEETETHSAITYSTDSDAPWIKKGKKAHYGYKAHISVDFQDGYILGGHVTPAHRSDTTELAEVINKLALPKGSLVLADKGYRDGIMDKAARNKPLNFV